MVKIASEAAGDASDVAEFRGVEEKFFHIASMCFGPFEPFMDSLLPIDVAEEESAAVGRGELSLKAAFVATSRRGGLEQHSNCKTVVPIYGSE